MNLYISSRYVAQYSYLFLFLLALHIYVFRSVENQLIYLSKKFYYEIVKQNNISHLIYISIMESCQKKTERGTDAVAKSISAVLRRTGIKACFASLWLPFG